MSKLQQIPESATENTDACVNSPESTNLYPLTP